MLVLLPGATLLPLTIETETKLSDYGVSESPKLTEHHNSEDYFFPIPVRLGETETISGAICIKPSPFVPPESAVTLRVDDRIVAREYISGSEGEKMVRFTVPPMSTPGALEGTSVRVNIEIIFNDTSLTGIQGSNSSQAKWVEICPKSQVTVSFPNTSPDWTSFAMLPRSLRNSLVIKLPAIPNNPQEEMFLKLASWLSFIRPNAKITVAANGLQPPPETDIFVIESSTSGGPAIRIQMEGTFRVIFLSVSSFQEVRNVWASLIHLSKFQPPVRDLYQPETSDKDSASKRTGAVPLGFLSLNAGKRITGFGTTQQSFAFDSALFGPKFANLEIDLRGSYRKLRKDETASIAVLLNDYQVYSGILYNQTTQFSFVTPLPASLLRARNSLRVFVHYSSDGGEEGKALPTFYWQLDPESTVSYKGSADIPPRKDLLEAGRQFFGRNHYGVVIESPDYLRAAGMIAIWLQKINPEAPLRPRLVNELPESGPSVLIGSTARMDRSKMRIPVEMQAGILEIAGPEQESMYFSPDGENLGLLQLIYRDPNSPVLFADFWGSDGLSALEEMLSDVAEGPWMGTGDLLIGNGQTPPLAFVPSKLQESKALTSDLAEDVSAGWRSWRWWIVGGIWLTFSVVVLWIYSKSRGNATKG